MDNSKMQKVSTVAPIQWLRGIAAIMVVVHHARNPAPWLFNPLEGYNAFAWGVDVFFVISGFVMYVAARVEPPLTFLKRRITRVVPLYWLATIALLVKNRELSFGWDELSHLAMSLLFIPHFSPPHSGEIFPYLVPGWSLNYEMLFYIIFCIGLFVKRPLEFTSAFIVFLICAGLIFDFTGNAIFLTFTSLQLIEFVAGIWIGYLFVNNKMTKPLSVLLPVGFCGLFSIPFLSLNGGEMWLRIFFSASIVIGATSLSNLEPRMEFLTKLGEASYSIYLSHVIVGMSLAGILTRASHLSGWLQFFIFIVLSILGSSLIGCLIYKFVERPLLRVMLGK